LQGAEYLPAQGNLPMPHDFIASLTLKTLVLDDALLILATLFAAHLLVVFVRWCCAKLRKRHRRACGF
jgi:hypothetical protein